MKKKICILGLGYIGLPTAAMFATHGHEIIGVDVSQTVVEALNQGKIIIEEPYLDIMVQAAVTSGNLTAQTQPEKSDVFIIAVPTPINQDKTADMSYVKLATKSIVPYLEKGNIVILESTSPPGTVENLMIPILEESGLKIGEELLLAHSPERVLPGKILNELVENNRIVGGINKESCDAVKDIYRTFVRGEIFLTDPTTAEMTKLMENTFRDVNIALANELAKICENTGINAWEVIKLANKHPRVNIHQPGPGVGGHCLAVDPWFIVEKQPELSNIIKLSRLTNDSMPKHVLSKIKSILNISNETKKITILGITYKPNIDDLRESPIIELIDLLEKEENIEINVIDPYVKNYKYLQKDLYKAVEGSDILILGVNHKEFLNLDYKLIKNLMNTPNILDTRNFLDKDSIEDVNLNYYLLGKKVEVGEIMKKVLMIAYQFPPMGGSGVQRSVKFAKYLRNFNWEPVIFTRDDNNVSLKDKTLLMDFPNDIKIIRTNGYDLTELPGFLNLFGKVISRKLLIPDGERIWQISSLKKAIKIVESEKIDLIYSTSYPYSDHLLGLKLKEKFPNIPWVSDFRDEWTNNPYLLDNPHYKLRSSIEKKMEEKIMSYSDLIITNTPVMKENFVKTYPFTQDKFHVIPNGFDEEDFKDIKRSNENNDKFTITYTGSFYGRRKPDVFFKSVTELIDEMDIPKSKIEIELIGNYKLSSLNNMINNSKLQDVVKVLPYMKHKESIRKLMNSDALLLIIGPGPGAEAFYTGKIFEYMRAGQPILALVPEKGVASNVIKKTNTGYVSDSRDKKNIKANIMKLFKAWENKSLTLNPNEVEINKFDRKEQSKDLSKLFNSLVEI